MFITRYWCAVKVLVCRTFKSLAAGLHFTCGLETGEAAYYWGNNYFGNLGVSTDMVTDTEHPDPLAVTGSYTFKQLAAGSSGDSRICGIRDNGELRCWGHNAFGQLDKGNTIDQLTPVQINLLP